MKAAGLAFPDFDKGDFALPTLRPALAGVMADLETGPGFKLLRGIPVEATADADNDIILLGTGPPHGKERSPEPTG